MDILLTLILGAVAIALAFPAPRKKLLALFNKKEVEHDFKLITRLDLMPPIDGEENPSYFIVWKATNKTEHPIQVDRAGIAMKISKSRIQYWLGYQFVAEDTIQPHHTIMIFDILLDTRSVNEWRHWFKEAEAFGFKDGIGKIHWIPDENFEAVSKELQKVALIFGLSGEVPEATKLFLQMQNINSAEE